MNNSYTQKEQYYSDYLVLDRILDAQFLESDARSMHAHDEMLFIITHQTYELWFKQIRYELNSILKIFSRTQVNDNTGDLQIVNQRMTRIAEIWKILVDQVRILETMTPMDFLDFRSLLAPASGFQSYQFRQLEAALGLRMQQRHQQAYYKHQLKSEDLDKIQNLEKEPSLFEALDRWLNRFPFWNVDKYWADFKVPEGADGDLHPFWASYKQIYLQNLADQERVTIRAKDFDHLFFGGANRDIRLSPAACRAVLFITIYRDYPILQLPFQFLDKLLQIDELMSNWRYRHMIMVRRMIGMRTGTGGSSGAKYLKGALESHLIFADLVGIATYLIPRHRLPNLPNQIKEHLLFRL